MEEEFKFHMEKMKREKDELVLRCSEYERKVEGQQTERASSAYWKSKYENLEMEFENNLSKFSSRKGEHEGKWKEEYKELDLRFKNYRTTKNESQKNLKMGMENLQEKLNALKQ